MTLCNRDRTWRCRGTARWALGCLLVLGRVTDAAAAPPDKTNWLGEQMPLPLSVRTPRDLDFKAAAERQYLIFNLLAGGKLDWDQGRFADAAARWESLLALPRLDPELAKLVRPMAVEARKRAGGEVHESAAPLPTVSQETEAGTASLPDHGPEAPVKARPAVTVSGSVEGGGAHGPGGAVLWLKRAEGPTPKPRPLRHAHMNQIEKTFVPHILTVTSGTTVTFNNKDPILHDVFSLTKPNDFDSGLFGTANPYQKVFPAPGAMQILCNIHASMLGYIVVVDSPWYGQADRNGRFHIRDVPPGKYKLYAWHEASSTVATSELSVGDEGVHELVVRVTGDVQPPNLVPDKYGKPRQRQLGY